MAESKSICFSLFINGHSEKTPEVDPNPIKDLLDISE